MKHDGYTDMHDDNPLGLVFTPDPEASTYALVKEYIQGFGWRGVRTSDVVTATGRDKKRVRESLGRLFEEGQVRMLTEPNPRRNGASPRLRWYSGFDPPASLSLGEDDDDQQAGLGYSDTYFEDTDDEH